MTGRTMNLDRHCVFVTEQRMFNLEITNQVGIPPIRHSRESGNPVPAPPGFRVSLAIASSPGITIEERSSNTGVVP
jgi:hypothetical protein